MGDNTVRHLRALKPDSHVLRFFPTHRQENAEAERYVRRLTMFQTWQLWVDAKLENLFSSNTNTTSDRGNSSWI